MDQEERKKVLVVDDESTVRESLNLILSRQYAVETAESGETAIDLLSKISGANDLPDVVLLDLMMPGIDGLGILEAIKTDHPSIPVVMLTASKAVRSAVEAMKGGAIDYLNKPYDVDELLDIIERAVERDITGVATNPSTRVHVRPDLPEIEGNFGALVGTHPLMTQLYSKIEQLAGRETTILISGESGTGKELVAKEIHRRSKRSEGPFIAVNCAAIPETLIESELFGHEKGAFTHAVEKRTGLFELANNGTLFLDEIGELSPPVQVKMLRFLQEQEFYRVGKSTPVKVDVRILAATNRSLEEAVKNGSFRQDLYYRIHVVSLEVPPLRERAEDIPSLITHLLEKLSPMYGNRKPVISDEALDTLQNYCWSGNVRELENIIESLIALNTSETIEQSDLPTRVRTKPAPSSGLKDQVLEGIVPFEEAEQQFEREIITKALQKCDYVQTRAAELLGISRRILKYKMDKLGIGDKPNSDSQASRESF